MDYRPSTTERDAARHLEGGVQNASAVRAGHADAREQEEAPEFIPDLRDGDDED